MTPTQPPRLATVNHMARFLADNVAVISGHQEAGQFFRDVDNAIDRIDRMINRPKPPRLLGPCRAHVDRTHDRQCPETHPHVCGIQLMAKLDDTRVECVGCRTSYDINDLVRQQINELDEQSFTLSELFKLVLPVSEIAVPLRTLQHWAATGKITPTGYTHTNEPRYLLGDIRELRNRKPQKAKTGAAARRTAR